MADLSLKMMKNSARPVLCALGAVLSWSTVATAFKLSLECMSWFSLLSVAIPTAAVCLFLIVLIQRKMALLLRIPLRELGFNVAIGLLNPLIYYCALFVAYDKLPAQVAQPLNYTWPMWFILLYAAIKRRKPSFPQVAGLVMSFLGVVVISFCKPGGAVSLSGILVAMASALLWAGYWMLGLRVRADRTVALLLGFGVSSVVVVALRLFGGMGFSVPGMGYAVYVGLFEMAIPFVLWQYALSAASNKYLINQLSYLSPVLSLVIINFYLGETLALTTILGAVLIIGGILVANRMREEAPDSSASPGSSEPA